MESPSRRTRSPAGRQRGRALPRGAGNDAPIPRRRERLHRSAPVRPLPARGVRVHLFEPVERGRADAAAAGLQASAVDLVAGARARSRTVIWNSARPQSAANRSTSAVSQASKAPRSTRCRQSTAGAARSVVGAAQTGCSAPHGARRAIGASLASGHDARSTSPSTLDSDTRRARAATADPVAISLLRRGASRVAITGLRLTRPSDGLVRVTHYGGVLSFASPQGSCTLWRTVAGGERMSETRSETRASTGLPVDLQRLVIERSHDLVTLSSRTGRSSTPRPAGDHARLRARGARRHLARRVLPPGRRTRSGSAPSSAPRPASSCLRW